jgi:predicted O-methyltransferase YrrM
LRDIIGTGPIGDDDGTSAGAWVDGFGVVAPDVARYGEVLRAVPDPVLLAMRNVAMAEGVDLVDADAATLIALFARSHRPRHVLEVGTGIGYLTIHLARAVPSDCVITSIDSDPTRQAQAHAFLERDELANHSATELRLGEPHRVLREGAGSGSSWDMVVLGAAAPDRLDLVDAVAPRMSPDALLVLPWALRGGRVANSETAWNGDDEVVEQQRLLNRCIATDPRFADVVLLPVGDGLLLARRV